MVKYKISYCEVDNEGNKEVGTIEAELDGVSLKQFWDSFYNNHYYKNIEWVKVDRIDELRERRLKELQEKYEQMNMFDGAEV